MVEKEAVEMLKVRPKESDHRDDILSLAFGVGWASDMVGRWGRTLYKLWGIPQDFPILRDSKTWLLLLLTSFIFPDTSSRVN